MSEINDVLKERGQNYGDFTKQARISQDIKTAMFRDIAMRGVNLRDYQREALEIIAHKLARIVNGNPDYTDSWIDIAGYAKLVADRLEKKDVTS
jgi:hypothetical protein